MENMPGMDHGSAHDQHDHQGTTTMLSTHMTFFWGKNAEILFSGWPGARTGMYVLALVFVFVLSVLVEWLANCSKINRESSCCGAVIRTIVHGVRIGLGYLVMLAVMSFNVGVLIVAVAGHTFGFFLFGSRRVSSQKSSDPDNKCFSSDRPTGC